MTCSFEDLFWSLPFAIGWIATRDAEKANVAMIRPEPALRNAQSDLWKKLCGGAVRANGRRHGERREIQAVEWLDLSLGKASAKPFLSGGGHTYFLGKGTVALARLVYSSSDVTTATMEPMLRTITYSDVRVASEDILREWPATVKRGDRKPPGRPAKTRDAIRDKMVKDYLAGYDLESATEEELRVKYNTKSRNPVRAARQEALSIIKGRQLKTKDN